MGSGNPSEAAALKYVQVVPFIFPDVLQRGRRPLACSLPALRFFVRRLRFLVYTQPCSAPGLGLSAAYVAVNPWC